MSKLTSICVYCGSANGNDPLFAAAAEEFGKRIADAGLRLVYGGGAVGLMGITARACLQAGGAVTGIIPQFLKDREVMLHEVSELIVTNDMHERKRAMFERSDAFVALPGGIGTLEELVEIMTWAQLGRHAKPIAVANIKGFWNPLATLINHMEDQGFLRKAFIGEGGAISYHVIDRIDAIIPTLQESLAARTRTEGDKEKIGLM